ncbi:MAG: hypothetical protein R2736_02420 [Solirubrobacterales bacterium]
MVASGTVAGSGVVPVCPSGGVSGGGVADGCVVVTVGGGVVATSGAVVVDGAIVSGGTVVVVVGRGTVATGGCLDAGRLVRSRRRSGQASGAGDAGRGATAAGWGGAATRTAVSGVARPPERRGA